MSELINANATERNIRWQLLASVSSVALVASLCAPAQGFAGEDAERPSVWLELGGALQRVDGGQESFAPPFILKHSGAPYNFSSPLSFERMPRSGFGGDAKITFEPKGTDWVFTAALKYGRSNAKRDRHQQTIATITQTNGYTKNSTKYKLLHRNVTSFNHTMFSASESHAVLDFAAGKDVGLGLLGNGGISTFNFGMRVAQFQSKSSTVFRSFPDPHYDRNAKYAGQLKGHHHSYYARAENERSFRGIGPSISWEAAAPIAGKPNDGGVTFDWGVNAALLFGRQKASGNHLTTGRYFMGSPLIQPPTSHYFHSKPFDRTKSKVVPNLGGFAGLSARYSHAKFSLGYRGDFFFGAMDGGIDVRDTRNRNFYGPYASISIGLGG